MASGLDLEEGGGSAHRTAGLVHEGIRPQEPDLVVVDSDVGDLTRELRAPGATMPPRQLVDDHVPDVVPVVRVLPAGIAKSDHEQVEGR